MIHDSTGVPTASSRPFQVICNIWSIRRELREYEIRPGWVDLHWALCSGGTTTTCLHESVARNLTDFHPIAGSFGSLT